MSGQRPNFIAPLLVSLLIPNVAWAQEAAPPEATPPPAETEASPEVEGEAPTETEGPAAAAEDIEAEEPEPAVEVEAEEEVEVPPPAPAAAFVEEPVAPAPSLLPLKVGTHTWSRFEVRENYDELGVSRTRFQEGDTTFFRARLSLETNPLQLTEDIVGLVNVSPQASGQWGTSGVGGTIGEANAGLYEGYFLLRGKYLEGKVGRFAMNYGDAAIIGNLDWHQAGRAFDGVHFRTNPGKAKVDFFLTQTSEGQPLQPEMFAGDTYFYGAYAMLGPLLAEGLDLDLYALGLSVAASDVLDPAGVPFHRDSATLATLGARVKQKISIIDYTVEGGVQVGKSPGGPPAGESLDAFAYMIDGEVGISPIPLLRIGVGGGLASGDDPSTLEKAEGWNELFPTGHKFLGLMDVIGSRTNVAEGRASVTVKPTKTTTGKVIGHLFARVEDGGLGRVPGSDSLAGFEVDTEITQQIGQWAYTRGLFGVFLPSAGHYVSDDSALYGELQAGLKF